MNKIFREQWCRLEKNELWMNDWIVKSNENYRLLTNEKNDLDQFLNRSLIQT